MSISASTVGECSARKAMCPRYMGRSTTMLIKRET